MNKALLSSNKMDYTTPKDFFNKLNKEFNFTLDPCCYPHTALCSKYYTEEDNGLIQDWGGEVVFCNPPYGRQTVHWVKKAYDESLKPDTIVVILIPARPDVSYFHDYILPYAEIRFIRGRLKFGGLKQSAPFPSLIAVFGRKEEE